MGKPRRLAEGWRPLCTPRPRIPTWRCPQPSRQPGGRGSRRVPQPLHSPRVWPAGRPVGEGRPGSGAPAGDIAPNPPRGAHTLRSTHPGLRSEIRPLVPTRVAAARDKRAAAALRLIYAAPRPAPRPPQRGRRRQPGAGAELAARFPPRAARGAGRGSSGVRGSFTPAPPLLALPLGRSRRLRQRGRWALGFHLVLLLTRSMCVGGGRGGGVCAACSCGCVGVHARSAAAPARRRQPPCAVPPLLFGGPEPRPRFSPFLGG